MRIPAALIAFSAVSLVGSMASACMGPMLHERSFLDALDEEAHSRPVVAEVVIREETRPVKPRAPFSITEVTVTNGIKGVPDGTRLSVRAPSTSCLADHEARKGESYFISGEMQDGVFSGVWRVGY